MGRRRRKQARAERDALSERPAAQGELLDFEPEGEPELALELPSLNGQAHSAAPPADPGEPPVNGARPRDLVLFEIVGSTEETAPLAAADASGAAPASEPPDAAAAAAAQPEPAAVPARVVFEETAHPDVTLERLEAERAQGLETLPLLLNLAWTLGLLGRFDDADRELRKAQKLAPDDVGVRAAVGMLCFRRGLYQQADAELRWVCEQDPQHGPAHFYRGEALNRLGRVEQALEVLEQAARLEPENHRAFYTMGILFDRKNLREQAAAMYRKARELSRR